MRCRFSTLLFVVIALVGVACPASAQPLRIDPKVRVESFAGDLLLRDLMQAPGGVGFMDAAFHKNGGARQVIAIAVLAPYGEDKVGQEQWTIAHGNGLFAAYDVTLIPDGEGGTTFTIHETATHCPPPIILGAGQSVILPVGQSASVPSGTFIHTERTGSTVNMRGHLNLVLGAGSVLIRVEPWATGPADNLVVVR